MIKEIHQVTIFEHQDGKNFVYYNGKYFEIVEDLKNLILDLLEQPNEGNNEKRN